MRLVNRMQELQTEARARTEQIRQLEYMVSGKDAIIAELRVRVQQLRDDLEKLQGVIAQAEDLVAYISERYRSESRKRLVKTLRNRIRLALSKSRVEHKTYEAINNSALFDRRFYLDTNPNVRAEGMDPVVHYLRLGSRGGRNPNPFFSEIGYQSRYPDVARAGLSAIQHYESYGRREGRQLLVAPILAKGVSTDATRSPPAPIQAQPRTVSFADMKALRQSLERSGLFEPKVYLEMNEDLRAARVDPWDHFLRAGISEGRRFTTPDLVARALSRSASDVDAAVLDAKDKLAAAPDEASVNRAAQELASSRRRIGVYCHSRGSFFIHEIANLVHLQLTSLGVNSHLRTEESEFDEAFDIRLFVAPNEFFYLYRGDVWRPFASVSNSVLFNIEQLQTPSFWTGFPLLLKAPLVLDINFHSACLLRTLGCRAVHYMPPYLPKCNYTTPQLSLSNVELVRGYEFSRRSFDWTQHAGLSERPIDILFIGTGSERRLKVIDALIELTDKYRFLCIYSHRNAPLLTSATDGTTSLEINCALAQRSKVVLNIHRDSMGYFEWSGMVMQGFWQGACVVSDPGLPDPIFTPGTHFLEEGVPDLRKKLSWLLDSPDGRKKVDEIGAAGHRQASSIAARMAVLLPMLNALKELVAVGGEN